MQFASSAAVHCSVCIIMYDSCTVTNVLDWIIYIHTYTKHVTDTVMVTVTDTNKDTQVTSFCYVDIFGIGVNLFSHK